MASDTLSYTHGTGPVFTDGTTTFSVTFNVQSLTANRALTLGDYAGTVAVNNSAIAASAPTAASTVTIAAFTGNNKAIVWNPAGTLATLTLSLADGGFNGQTVDLYTSQIVTALTLTGNFAASVGAAQPTALTAGQYVKWVWDATSKWVRIV